MFAGRCITLACSEQMRLASCDIFCMDTGSVKATYLFQMHVSRIPGVAVVQTNVWAGYVCD